MRAPVARQHLLVHAPAAIHQHEDLGAVAGARHLRFGPARARPARARAARSRAPRSARQSEAGQLAEAVARQPGADTRTSSVSRRLRNSGSSASGSSSSAQGWAKSKLPLIVSCRFSIWRSSVHSARTETRSPATPRTEEALAGLREEALDRRRAAAPDAARAGTGAERSRLHDAAGRARRRRDASACQLRAPSRRRARISRSALANGCADGARQLRQQPPSEPRARARAMHAPDQIAIRRRIGCGRDRSARRDPAAARRALRANASRGVSGATLIGHAGNPELTPRI